jgi:hypothetical protein
LGAARAAAASEPPAAPPWRGVCGGSARGVPATRQRAGAARGAPAARRQRSRLSARAHGRRKSASSPLHGGAPSSADRFLAGEARWSSMMELPHLRRAAARPPARRVSALKQDARALRRERRNTATTRKTSWRSARARAPSAPPAAAAVADKLGARHAGCTAQRRAAREVVRLGARTCSIRRRAHLHGHNHLRCTRVSAGAPPARCFSACTALLVAPGRRERRAILAA